MNELPEIVMTLPGITWSPWIHNEKGLRRAEGSIVARYRLKRQPVAFKRLRIHADISRETWVLLGGNEAAIADLMQKRKQEAEHKLKYIMQEFSRRREIRLYNKRLDCNQLVAVKSLKWITVADYTQILRDHEQRTRKLRINVVETPTS